jgi:uncharacterized membrane protein (UPF0127 family)
MGSRNDTFAIVNTRTSRPLADCAWSARSYYARLKGLLGDRELEQGRGLLIPWCSAIHTCFMKMKIDVVFVDRGNRVVRTFQDARPFRLFWGGRKAHSVIELPTGTISCTGTQAGDLLECQPK